MATKQNGFYVDGKYFYPVGVNYWPRDTAVYQWPEYDEKAVEHEFSLMKAMGINCIRCFIKWTDLLAPGSRDSIDDSFFPKFAHFHDTAARHGIKLIPTFFIGHMSGQDWFPDWFNVTGADVQAGVPFQVIRLPPRKRRSGKVRDIYLDDAVYRAAFAQLDALLPKYKDSSTILSWDLSNENQYMMPPSRPEHGAAYMRRLRERIRQLDSNHPVTLGMGKFSEKTGFHSFGEHSFAAHEDYYSVHSYLVPYYPMSINLLDYYTSYKTEFDVRMARASGIPVQQQEFGISNLVFALRRKQTRDLLLGGYYRTAIWGSFAGGSRHGILAWCFADFARSMAKRNPYAHKPWELQFGVLDRAYQPKITGKELARFASIAKVIDVEHLAISPSRVAIIFPENYLEYKDLHASKAELLDDNPIRKHKYLVPHVDCLQNQNRALFSAFVFCRMAGVMPDFLPAGAPLDGYKVAILPNVKTMSDAMHAQLDAFMATGGFVYISSNDFVPRGIKGMEHASPVFKSVKQRHLTLAPAPGTAGTVSNAFGQLARFVVRAERLHVDGLPAPQALYVDDATRLPVACYFPPRVNVTTGGMIFMGVAP
ncbi:MAG: cellulase family glycosylhydrolase, partial [Candidatus Sigynarchaeum springense]